MGNIMAAFAYLLNWVSGLIVFIVAKDDKVARFHGLQSILFTIVYFIIFVILAIVAFILVIVLGIVAAALNLGAIGALLVFIPWALLLLVMVLIFLVWLWTMWQAYNDRMFKLPFIGGLAEKWSA